MSRREFMGVVSGSAGALALGLAPRLSLAAAAGSEAKSVTFFDTGSGANFVQWWQAYAVPKYTKENGVEVKYTSVPSAETLQRIKAWGAGQGDVDVLLLQTDKFAQFANEGVLETLQTLSSLIPNLAKSEPPDNREAAGVAVEGRGTPFFRYQYVMGVNTAEVKRPPAGIKELFSRAGEWKGRISYTDPRSPISTSGRFVASGFLRAFGCDFGLPGGQENATWGPAWEKLIEFERFGFPKHANSGGEHFAQFTQGDIVIGFQAFDFIHYTKKIGSLPASVSTVFMEEGLPGGASYLAIPKGLSEPRRLAAARFINFAISDEVQTNMVVEMFEFPGTNIWDKLPKSAYQLMPTREVYQKRRLPDPPLAAIQHIADVWATKLGYGK
jgi:ABC-type uncharacterized transport system YnjBCD substrate-binding protein